MKININQFVKVKLNEYGLFILEEQHKQLREIVPSLGDFKKPEVDENGFTEFQLWYLMRTFGPYINLGSTPPFEITIIIEEE